MRPVHPLLARLAGIDWRPRPDHQRSRIVLLREHLRRTALWCLAIDAAEAFPFLDIVAHTNPERAYAVQLALALPPLDRRVRLSIDSMIRFEASGPARPELPHPYAALLAFYERGGGFRVENRCFACDLASVPFGVVTSQARIAETLDPDDTAALDALDLET